MGWGNNVEKGTHWGAMNKAQAERHEDLEGHADYFGVDLYQTGFDRQGNALYEAEERYGLEARAFGINRKGKRFWR